MNPAVVLVVLSVGVGLALLVAGLLIRVRDRERALAEILELPYGERDVPVATLTEAQGHSPIVEGTVDFAGKVVDRFDDKGSLAASLERARIPLRPGEYAVVTAAGSIALAAVFYMLFSKGLFAVLGAGMGPLVAMVVLRKRISKRRKAFEEQLPDALTLIASSLSAGHTFLRAIQMMCEESEPPLAEEFARLVSETRLGDPVVDALDRMSQRLQIRDLDWVVQAIRIQQTVGGRLADILHTLAEFIRAREEVRREVRVLTAEGRVSAYVLAGLAPLMFFAVQLQNPEYIQPMLQGWGIVVMAVTGTMVVVGTLIIFRMVKIEV